MGFQCSLNKLPYCGSWMFSVRCQRGVYDNTTFMFCLDTSHFLLPRTIRGQNMKRCSSFEVSRLLISASFADLRDLVDVK